jgi:uncharacterized protein (DUF39 family)/CBS domain-containing protein
MENIRTIEEINDKIKKGDAIVVTAEEMVDIVKEKGSKVAAKEIDVVTTGTFGAMCSSGAFFNFGHSDPPIKMEKLTLNGIEAYHGNAAVDCYLGVTKMHPERRFEYGGGHVIEELISGKEIELEATASGTDCYPRKFLKTILKLDDLNQAILCNPRNAYQRYATATNSSDELIYTYMGKLLPNYGNATYSGAGSLSPLSNDPDYETIGIGNRIFLGGGIGYITNEGTQHDPKNKLGTIMVHGDLKQMKPKFLKGASFTGYGTSIYVGLGIPIPILNEGLAKKTGISDEEIKSNVLDYAIGRRSRPVLKETNYAELKSGKVLLDDKEIPVTPLSSIKESVEISNILKKWIEKGTFFLTAPVERLSRDRVFKPLNVASEIPLAKEIMDVAVTCKLSDDIDTVAKKIINENVNHVAVVDEDYRLLGISTSFDITKAVATGKTKLSDIMTKNVITAKPENSVNICAKKLEEHDISALPVVDRDSKIIGIVTSEKISSLLGKE